MTTTEALTPFQEAIPEIRAMIAEQNWPGMNLLLGDFHSAEIADEWDEFEFEEKLAILRHFKVQRAVDVFEELELDRQQRLIQRLTEGRATALLEEMAPDERADLFQEFPAELRERFLKRMEAEEAQDVLDLIGHEAESAGGLMTTDFAWARAGDTVGEAIRRFRENFHEAEAVYYVYVLDQEDRLEGVVTLRQLLLTPDSSPVRDIMQTKLITLAPDLDREDAAHEMAAYDLMAVPVVDATNRMLGIITHDDVLDVLEDEATEDFEQFGGIIPSDEDATYLRMPVMAHCRLRIPWLVLLLFLSSISGFLIMHYDGVITSTHGAVWFALLVALAPMLMATAGNAGTQSATVVIRDMARGELELSELGRVFLKEVGIGLLLGGILAVCAFVRALVPASTEGGGEAMRVTLAQSAAFGGILALSIFLLMVFATTAGAVLPMVVKRFNLDPAVMSSPLLATIIDNVTVFVYFTIGILALSLFLGVN